MRRQQLHARQAASADMSGDINSQEYLAATSHGGVQLYNPAQFMPVNDKQDVMLPSHPTMPVSQHQQSGQEFFHQQSGQYYYPENSHVAGQERRGGSDNAMNGQHEWYGADARHGQPVVHDSWQPQHQLQQSAFTLNPDAQLQGQMHRSFSDVWNNWGPQEQPNPGSTGAITDTFRPEGQEGTFKHEPATWQQMNSYGQSGFQDYPHMYSQNNTYDNYKNETLQHDPSQGFTPISQNNYASAACESGLHENVVADSNWPSVQNIPADIRTNTFNDYNDESDPSVVFGLGEGDEDSHSSTDKIDKSVVCDSTVYDDVPHDWEGDKPRPQLLRADSWISNSSLLTYNRSMTGSQEMLNSLSSLPCGEDGAGNVYHHAFGDHHASLPPMERLSLAEHPFKRSISPLACSDPPRLPPLDHTAKATTGEKCVSPTLSNVSNNSMPQPTQMDDNKSSEEISGDASNNKPDVDVKLPSGETDTGNVEVLDSAGFKKPSVTEADLRPKPTLSAIGHRDGSPFKAVASGSSAVIQHEVVPVQGPKPEVLPVSANNIGANLESTPDNVEHPVDLDVAATASLMHTGLLNPRQRSRDLQGNSPTATLWENPEPSKAFNVVLAPAGSIVPQQQSVIVVAPYANQVPAQMSKKPESSIPHSGSDQSQTAKSTPSVQQRANIQIMSGKNVAQEVKVQHPAEVAQLQRPALDNPPDRQMAAPQMPAAGEITTPLLPADKEMTAHHPSSDFHQDHKPQRDQNYDSRRRSREEQSGSGQNYRDRDRRPSYSQNVDFDERGHRRDNFREDHHQERLDRSRRERDQYDRPRDADPYYPRSDHERPRDRPHTPASAVGSMQEPFQNSRDYRDRNQSPARFQRHSRDHGDPNRRTPERPQSRDGSESDHGSGRYAGAPYDPYRAGGHYSRDARYQGYDYSWYSRQQQYYTNPYYANPYNYGYYTELYGSDPRYQNYYGTMPSMARGYNPYYGYVDYERRSLSGRSSVTDEIQQERGRFSEDFHRPSSQPSASMEQSTIYAYDDQNHPRGPAEFVDVSFRHTEESDSAGTFVESRADRLTPVKFSYPHCKAVFSNNAQLLTVLPNSVLDGQPAVVEIKEIQSALNADLDILRDFPGPLVRGQTHKNDIINFCTRKLRQTAEDVNLVDRDSQILMWEFLILLVRQNGVVVGTDIAELLVKSKPEVYDNLHESRHTDNDGLQVSSDRSVLSETLSEDKATEKFRELLLFGRRKDALEWAVTHGQWGHALVLASKMDNKTYAYVLTRFTNSFPKNDPLQTLYQLMSGRQPAAVTCVADERWGNWRSHLAMILSNTSLHPEVDRKSIITLGDTLASRGCIHAAHFCYIVAEIDIGHFSKKSSKFVLVGANHGLPFEKFASNEAIQCTELFEYAQSLSNKEFILPAFQPYKFLYATRLAEVGMLQEALQYCEVIESTMFKAHYSSNYTLIQQVYELGDKLKNIDTQLALNRGDIDDQSDPQWLTKLKEFIDSPLDVGALVKEPVHEDNYNLNAELQYTLGSTGLPTLSPATDSQQQQYPVITSAQQQTNWIGVGEHNNYVESDSQYNNQYLEQQYSQQYSQQYDIGQDDKIAPSPQKENETRALTSSAAQSNHYQVAQPLVNNYLSPRSEEFDYRGPSSNEKLKGLSQHGSPSLTSQSTTKSVATAKSTETKKKNESQTSQRKQGGGWLGGIFSKLSLRGKNQMILPDDKNPTIVWDAATGSWLNTEAGEDEGESAPAAPPTDLQLNPNSSPTAALGSNSNNMVSELGVAASTVTGYKLHGGRRKGMRQNYVDVLAGNTTATKSTPPSLFQNMETLSTTSTPQFFIPAPANVAGDDDTGMVDFVTRATLPQVGNPKSRPSSPSDDTETEEKQEPQTPQAPMMFDPEVTGRATMKSGPTMKLGLGRYGRYPK